jgi:hypothetical protein
MENRYTLYSYKVMLNMGLWLNYQIVVVRQMLVSRLQLAPQPTVDIGIVSSRNGTERLPMD